ncbi:winged helix-turn-helix transcriptional regulator [Paenibacillus massiliensis]|uniref:winged helix-turn-helix transcriptional regulator n=1 Tax=Paenibacillus massiliensis TaxID=225917 RepID=UPI00299F43A3|nr:winged helix-turn-helix transcriptional regulator [Paenibacillus massiliensis]
MYNQMPPKVEYYITEYGITANKIIDVMCSWGRHNIKIQQQQGEEVKLLENN